jgi:hypothetical protein
MHSSAIRPPIIYTRVSPYFSFIFFCSSTCCMPSYSCLTVLQQLIFFFVRSWKKQYAASREVASFIPSEVIGFFSWPNSFSRSMALGSTQPLTEMSTRDLLGVKCGRSIRLTTSLLFVSQLSWKCVSLYVSLLWASAPCYRDNFTFYHIIKWGKRGESVVHIQFVACPTFLVSLYDVWLSGIVPYAVCPSPSTPCPV